MSRPVLRVGSAAKGRATLQGGAASLEATACRASAPPAASAAPRRTPAVRPLGSTEGEDA